MMRETQLGSRQIKLEKTSDIRKCVENYILWFVEKKVKHQHRPDQINKNNIFVHRPQLVNFVTTTTKHDDKCIINIPMHAMAKLAPHGCNSRKDEITVDKTKDLSAIPKQKTRNLIIKFMDICHIEIINQIHQKVLSKSMYLF